MDASFTIFHSLPPPTHHQPEKVKYAPLTNEALFLISLPPVPPCQPRYTLSLPFFFFFALCQSFYTLCQALSLCQAQVRVVISLLQQAPDRQPLRVIARVVFPDLHFSRGTTSTDADQKPCVRTECEISQVLSLYTSLC